jgi:hypothetical protein
LSEGPEAGLGLSCTKDGLFLGATPLLERERGGSFLVRPQSDLERLLASGYEADVALDRAMPGLRAVASALNASDLCRARIAAVHLRIPPLPDGFARLDMQLEDVSLTLERIEKTTAAGNWDPAKHPRAGTAPIPAGSRRPMAAETTSSQRSSPTIPMTMAAFTCLRPSATTRSAISSNGS